MLQTDEPNAFGDLSVPHFSRRALIAVATSALFVVVGGSTAEVDAYGSSRHTRPANWLIEEDVSLKITKLRQDVLACSGHVGAVPLTFELNSHTNDAAGGSLYVYSGKYGAEAAAATVSFGADQTSFLADGTLGTTAVRIDCPPQPTGAARYPLTGNIGDQPLQLVLDISDPSSGPQLTGTLGKTKVEFAAIGSSSSTDFKGSTAEAKESASTILRLTQSNEGGTPVDILSGRVSGPIVGMIAALAWVPTLITGD